MITPPFSKADSVSFWIKGNSTDTANVFYVLESTDTLAWDTIAAISPLPTANYPLNAARIFAVKPTSKRLKFYYKKIAGNMAFDDFFLTKRQSVVADFSASGNSACVGSSVCFSDSSSAACGSVVSWDWDFGDGNVSTAQNPCNTFTTAGTYNVKLTVTKDNAEVDSTIKTVSIGEFPVASFLPNDSDGCAPFLVNYQDASAVSSGIISSYSWDFGNGSTSTLQNPSQSFSAGTFPVSLVVTTDLGCTDTTTGSVTAFQPPVAGFTFYGALCDSIYFTDISTGNNLSWQWDFGDMTSSTEQNPSHLFPWGVYFTVSLSVTDNNGCSNTFVNDSVVDFCSSVGEQVFSGSLAIYPNPSNGKFTIEFSSNSNSYSSVRITNVFGEEVYLSETGTGQTEVLDLSDMPGGTYLATFTIGENLIRKKIVLVR